MIDPGKLYDWLEKQDIEIVSWVPREKFEELFREYVAELTSRG